MKRTIFLILLLVLFMLQGQENIQRSVARYKNKLVQNPENYQVRFRLACLYLRNSQYLPAEKHYLILLHSEHNPARLCRINQGLGDVYQGLSKKQKSLVYYRRALSLVAEGHWRHRQILASMKRIQGNNVVDNFDIEGQLKKAGMLDKQGKKREAVALYLRLLKVAHPYRDYIQGELGSLYWDLGEKEQAKFYWQAIAPQIRVGILLDHQLVQEAERVYSSLMAKYPQESKYYRPYIELLQRRKNKQKIAEVYRKWLVLDPENLLVVEQAMDFFAQTKDRKRLLEMLPKFYGMAAEKIGGVYRIEPNAAREIFEKYDAKLELFSLLEQQVKNNGDKFYALAVYRGMKCEGERSFAFLQSMIGENSEKLDALLCREFLSLYYKKPHMQNSIEKYCKLRMNKSIWRGDYLLYANILRYEYEEEFRALQILDKGIKNHGNWSSLITARTEIELLLNRQGKD